MSILEAERHINVAASFINHRHMHAHTSLVTWSSTAGQHSERVAPLTDGENDICCSFAGCNKMHSGELWKSGENSVNRKALSF